jgi:hypothetical protein
VDDDDVDSSLDDWVYKPNENDGLKVPEFVDAGSSQFIWREGVLSAGGAHR